MTVRCPYCKNITNELMSCDNCNKIGCVRCIIKHSNQWLCVDCRKISSNQSAFPKWFG